MSIQTFQHEPGIDTSGNQTIEHKHPNLVISSPIVSEPINQNAAFHTRRLDSMDKR